MLNTEFPDFESITKGIDVVNPDPKNVLRGLMGLLNFADGNMTGDNRAEYEEVWMPLAELSLKD